MKALWIIWWVGVIGCIVSIVWLSRSDYLSNPAFVSMLFFFVLLASAHFEIRREQ